MVVVVVGILVPFAIAQFLHQFGRSVAQVQRYGEVARLLHEGEGGIDAHVGRVALGAGGEVYGGFGQGYAPFGPANLHHCIEGCIGDEQCVGIGQTDILGGRDDQSAGNEGRVFATLYHAGEPVERSVGVAATDRLDVGRHDVVVHLAILVVGQGVLLQTLGDHLVGYDNFFAAVGLDDEFKRIEQLACIASRETQQGIGLFDHDVTLFQVEVLLDGAVEQFQEVSLVERLEDVELATGE